MKVSPLRCSFCGCLLAVLLAAHAIAGAQAAPTPAPDDPFSDTWVATDALGRSLPGYQECGPPRRDRFVGIFYFLWLGEHANGGPYDVTKVLARDPKAMEKPDSPLWGPMHAPHHWGESIFGYYLSTDRHVLRKHAQMLSDAGVDTVIFDVTNQFTYRKEYRALLEVFADVRRCGGRTPQVAFLCPFWDPAKVVNELYDDLYAPQFHPELWFRWEGKPLILADLAMLVKGEGTTAQDFPSRLEPGHSLGQSFTIDKPFTAVGGRFPTWSEKDSGMTLTVRRGGPTGPVVATRRLDPIADNAWGMVPLDPPQPPGTYILEMSDPKGPIGWWSSTKEALATGEALADGKPVAGDRTLRIVVRDDRAERIRSFFTFRKPQPSYFEGPTGPDMWSWLEVHPQHIFRNSRGEKEQMSVGVGQNAVDGRLGSMSEPNALGRSYHKGKFPTEPDAVLHGYNLAEQWERALKEDPKFVFVTGWNEWIMGRFAEFAGVKYPVMFVDQFDQEHSRDIEPMKGGHGDNYTYQLIAAIRRYKGVRPLPPVVSRPIAIDSRFQDWAQVQPEFRDTPGDPARRDHPGYATAGPYTNDTGRNDIVAAKVSCDARSISFYVRAREALSPHSGANWMLLFLDADANPKTGWLGYDFVVNRTGVREGTTTIERHLGGGYRWGSPVDVPYRLSGAELELSIPRSVLGVRRLPATIDLKWADNIRQTGEASDFTLNGDAAPNDRHSYRAVLR